MRTPFLFVGEGHRWVPRAYAQGYDGAPFRACMGEFYVSFTLLMAILPEKQVATSDPGSDSLWE